MARALPSFGIIAPTGKWLPTVKTRFRRGCISNLAPQPGVRELLSQIDYGPAHENRELAWSSNRYLPYYLVRVVLKSGYDGIANGMRRTDIHDRIRQIHHRGDDGISKDTLREVGICPFIQGILLWIVIASGSLALIHAG